MKGLAEEFQNQVTCLGKNTEKYITFAVSIEKEVTKINKNGEEITKNISYILQFIDSARFMARPLSNLVDNLSEEIHRIKCKYGHDDKNVKIMELLGYTNFKDGLIIYVATKTINKKFAKNLKEQFLSRYSFSNDVDNKFILLLRKGVYPYEYIVDRGKKQ